MKNKNLAKLPLDLERYINRDGFDYILIAFALVLGVYLKWTLPAVLTFAILIWMILKPASSRLYAKISLVILTLTALFYFVKRPERAEQLAAITLLFLAATAISTLLELIKSSKSGDEFESKN